MPTPIAIGWLAVWPLIAGCQSGAQQDLIARELRMHEDQIYAMEDYLTQYQQLVCKYRSENEALRRRLADEYYDEDALPAPRRAPRAGGEQTTTPGGTSIEIREAPRPDGQRSPSREIEIEVPDVPPLESSTLNQSTSPQLIRAVHLEVRSSGSNETAAGESTPGEAASPARKPRANSSITLSGMARAQKIVAQSPPPLRLHGEVVASDAGGGPRLIVNVEQLDGLGNSGAFDGEASIMLLAPTKPRHQQRLARWDYDKADVQTAKDDAGVERTLRFYLELPAGTPIDPSTELWVRLVPPGGEKLLAHTKVDLRLPGRFASPAASDGKETRFSDAAIATANVLEGDWSIARPGEPANLPSAEEVLTGGWRTSSEPIPAPAKPPVILQASGAGSTKRQPVRQAQHVDTSGQIKSPAYKRPTWSPDRPSEAAPRADIGEPRETALSNGPAWSATR